jgi:hypothetical protein
MMIDGWSEFSLLPDSAPTTTGPFRGLAWAHDHRVGPLLPAGLFIGTDPNVHTSRWGVPAVVNDDARRSAAAVVAGGDVLMRPADSSEAIAWREVSDARSATVLDGTRGLEVARIDVPEQALVVVEGLATYLRATPVGVEDPTTFVTDCCSDPFGAPTHPTGGEQLRVRWALLGVASSEPSLDGAAHGVTGIPIQIQPYWSDLRFAWGSRYTTGLQLLVPPACTSIRLVAIPDAQGAAWTVSVGGRLRVWWIPAGPHGRALEAATSRTGR